MIRHPLPRQGGTLPIKLLTLLRYARYRTILFIPSGDMHLQAAELESAHFIWKTNALPLYYARLYLHVGLGTSVIDRYKKD